MQDFPVLRTPRLTLRNMQIEDVDALVQYANNPNVSRHILNMSYPYREPDGVFRLSYVVQGYKNKTRYVFAIILKSRNELIGEVSLHIDAPRNMAQLAYWIGEPFWGQGITTEAAQAAVQFGFEQLKLHTIFATYHEDNPASGRVLEKIGMVQHGVNGGVVQYVVRAEIL